LGDKHKLQVLEHGEVLHDEHRSPSIVRTVKSKVWYAANVALVEKQEMLVENW